MLFSLALPKVPIIDFFRRSTIERLAEYIRDSSKKSAYSTIELAEEKEYYILSSAQKRLYILQQLENDNISYNLGSAVLLEGALEKDKLEKTLWKMIERHESLRTSFDMIEDEPIQRIHKNTAFRIEYHIITGTQVETEIKEIINNSNCPFDLSQAPLLRVGLIKLPEKP